MLPFSFHISCGSVTKQHGGLRSSVYRLIVQDDSFAILFLLKILVGLLLQWLHKWWQSLLFCFMSENSTTKIEMVGEPINPFRIAWFHNFRSVVSPVILGWSTAQPVLSKYLSTIEKCLLNTGTFMLISHHWEPKHWPLKIGCLLNRGATVTGFTVGCFICLILAFFYTPS